MLFRSFFWRRAPTLGPYYLRRPYPTSTVTATVASGDEYVYLSADPLALRGDGGGAEGTRSSSVLAPLRNGDTIAIGGQLTDSPVDTFAFANSYPDQGEESHTADGHADAEDLEAAAQPTTSQTNSIAFPAPGKPGVVIRFVAAGERRLRLQEKWARPSFASSP